MVRFVFSRLADEQDRNQWALQTKRALSSLRAVSKAEVRVPADAQAEVWDLSVVLHLASTPEMLMAEAAYEAWFDELSQASVVVKAWNFR